MDPVHERGGSMVWVHGPGVHVLYFPYIDTLPHKVCSPTPRHANHNFVRIFPAQLVVTKDYQSAFDTVTLIYISLK